MVLAAEDVVALQQFLLDAAKRYVVPGPGGIDAAEGLLTNAAALDYVLLLASERGDETLDDGTPIASGLRETLARAANAALDFVQTMIAAPPDIFEDFKARHLGGGGLFETLRDLREGGALPDGNVAFRSVTMLSDLTDRAF